MSAGYSAQQKAPKGVTNAARVRAFKVKKLLPEMSKGEMEKGMVGRGDGNIKSKECRRIHAKSPLHQLVSSMTAGR